MVIVAIRCLQVPIGTLPGVFTIVVLSRPTVRRLYGLAGTTARPAQDSW
jgi:hypothetical protein